jgi:cytochrome c553
VRCHFQVPKADKVKDITMPIMATCVTCHAGEVAFNYTQCLKCHGPEIEKMAVPEGHKVQPAKAP